MNFSALTILNNLTTSKAAYVSFVVWLILCVVAILGFNQLKFAADYTSYFSEEDLQFNRFEAFQREFSQGDQLVLMLESTQDNDIKQHLPFIEDLTSALSQLPFVKGVGGFKAQYFNPQVGALALGNNTNPALDEFVATDNSAVLLSLDFDELASNDNQDIAVFLAKMQRVKSLIDQKITQYDPDMSISYSGALTLNWQYAEVLKHDLMWFLPGLIFLLGTMLFFVVSEKWWIAGIATSSLVTLLCTIGLAAWSHFTLAAISAFVPVIVVTLNVAYSMHLYFDWRHQSQRQFELGNNHAAAEVDRSHTCSQDLKSIASLPLIDSMQRNFQPLLWGGITTAFGFILLRFSPSPPIQDFGTMVAFAVLINFLSNYTILIAFARIAKYQSTHTARLSHFCEYLHQLSWYFRRPILAVTLLLSLVAVTSLTQLRFDDDAANYFPADNPFSVSNSKMEEKFSGVNQLNFVVNSTTTLGITESSYIKNINQFSRFLAQQDEVINSRSIVDWLKWYGLGQHQFKQLLTDNSIQKLGAQQLINVDSSASLLRVHLTPMTASELLDFEAKVLSYLDHTGLNKFIEPPLSQQLIFAHLSRQNSWTMLSSFAAALVLLFLLLILLKRSFKLACLGLLANVLPLIFVFGFWQSLGGSLSLGSAVVMGMILGIIIDDSLHLLLKVRPNKNADVDSKVFGFSAIMPAITFTSVLLILGFSLGLGSDFFPIIELSLLSMMTLFVAWFFDLVVLPICYRLAAGEVDDQ